MPCRRRLVAWALVLALGGCESSPLSDSAWAPSRPWGQQVSAYRPPAQPAAAEAPAPPNPQGELTLNDAMAAALLGHPDLARYGYDLRAAEARALQARRWPNPEVELEFENFAGRGERRDTQAMETTLWVSQTFPLGDDLRRRRQLAEAQGRLAGWDYESARVALLAEVAQRFAAVLAAQQRLALTEEALSLAQQIEQAIDRRVQVGDLAAVERARSAVATANAAIAHRRAQRQLQAARMSLALSWGSSEPGFTIARGDIEQAPPIPSLTALVALLQQNPEMARWAVEIASRQAELELARAQAVPDLTAGLGYRWFSDSDDGAMVGALSLPLPIFDQGQGDKLAARWGVSSAHAQRKSAELHVAIALHSAYTRLADAHDEAVTLRDVALPAAMQAWQDVRQAFDRGDLGYLDVIDAQRTLVELRGQRLDALANYHAAVAEIQGLIGQSLHDVDAGPNQATEIQQP